MPSSKNGLGFFSRVVDVVVVVVVVVDRRDRFDSSRQKVNKVFAASSQTLFTSSGSGFVEFCFLWNTVARVVLYDQAGAGGREGVFRRRCRCYLWHGRILAGLRRPERG